LSSPNGQPQAASTSTSSGKKTDDWHSVPTPQAIRPLQWGFKENYLIVGIGMNEADNIWERKGKPGPDWLTKLSSDRKVERPAMVNFVNLQQLVAIGQLAMAGNQGLGQSQEILDTLGLRNLKSFGNVSGLEKDGFVSRTLLATDGPPAGVLSLL